MEIKDILADIMECLPARRGKLFKQYYTKTGADGKTRRQGPYYVLTRSIKGETVSERISPKDAERVQADLDRGKALAKTMDGIWSMAEHMARDLTAAKKKALLPKSRRRP